jgi:hypothetical protein
VMAGVAQSIGIAEMYQHAWLMPLRTGAMPLAMRSMVNHCLMTAKELGAELP